MKSFESQIDRIRKLRPQNPKRLTFNLANARTDEKHSIAGNYFYVSEAPNNTYYVDIKFNELDSDYIRLFNQTGVRTPFDEFYITIPAGQAGNMTIIIGQESPELFEFLDNRAAVEGDIAGILEQLTGDTTPDNWGTEKTVTTAAQKVLDANTDRKAFVLAAKITNTGYIYVGFDNTVTTTKYFEQLSPGKSIMIDDYCGEIWVYGSAAGQLLGWGEW